MNSVDTSHEFSWHKTWIPFAHHVNSLGTPCEFPLLHALQQNSTIWCSKTLLCPCTRTQFRLFEPAAYASPKLGLPPLLALVQLALHKFKISCSWASYVIIVEVVPCSLMAHGHHWQAQLSVHLRHADGVDVAFALEKYFCFKRRPICVYFLYCSAFAKPIKLSRSGNQSTEI